MRCGGSCVILLSRLSFARCGPAVDRGDRRHASLVISYDDFAARECQGAMSEPSLPVLAAARGAAQPDPRAHRAPDRANHQRRTRRRASQLPTEQELIAATGVSRTVVREAVAALRAEGLVITRQGVGAFVAEIAAPAVPHRRRRASLAAARDRGHGAAHRDRGRGRGACGRARRRPQICVRIEDALSRPSEPRSNAAMPLSMRISRFHCRIAEATGNPQFAALPRLSRPLHHSASDHSRRRPEPPKSGGPISIDIPARASRDHARDPRGMRCRRRAPRCGGTLPTAARRCAEAAPTKSHGRMSG